MHAVTVQTSDDMCFVVPPTVCEYSTLLRVFAEEEDDAGEVPLKTLKSEVFTLVLEFIHLYHATPFKLVKPMLPSLYHQVVPEQHRVYMNQFKDASGKPTDLFYQTINAANFLGVETLLALMCAFLANLLSCKPAEEIKRLLSYFGFMV